MADENGKRAEARAFEERESEETALTAPVDADDGGAVLRLVVDGDAPVSWARIDGMVTGRLLGLRDGCPVVDFPAGPPGGVPARTVVDVSEGDAGREVALMFDGGSPARPVVLGLVRPPVPGAPGAMIEPPAPAAPAIEPPAASAPEPTALAAEPQGAPGASAPEPPAPAARAPEPRALAAEPQGIPGVGPHLSVSIDGDAVVLAAEREIVLRCGKASLTLTREGHVVLRGEYVLSRATGVNRIKGGSVQIN